MHQISKIKIENYKSIVSHEFPLSPFTPLVGYNNAGKTNVLQAASWLVKKSSLPEADFFDRDKPIVVTASISGITVDLLGALDDKHRTRIEPFIKNQEFSIRRRQCVPGDSVKKIVLEVQKQDGLEWDINPGGIDQAISALFPEPLFIGAMEDAAEDVGKNAAGTTIGKLIREIIGPVSETHSGPVTAALTEISKKLSAEGEHKDEILVDIDNKIQTELVKFFPGVSAKTHIPTPEFSDFVKGATIKIFEDASNTLDGRDAASFGHGAQRAVQIALIKCLSEIKRQGLTSGRTTLLLIDEPELYLHPQAVEIVRTSLSHLSSEGYQVLFSTHSPGMISRDHAPNTLLVRRNSEKGTYAYPRMQDAVATAIDGADHQADTLFSLTNASKVLFSEMVALVEGKTERALLPDIFAHEYDATMGERKLGLVALGSVDNVPNAINVLKAMGIPTKSIVDLDFAFKGAVNSGFIDEGNAALLGCKDIFCKLRDAGKIEINDNGLPQKSAGGVTAAQAFVMMAAEPDAKDPINSLHAELLDSGVWCWTKGAIENHLGLTSKKPAAHRKFLSDIKTDGFLEAQDGYDSVKKMLDWLQEQD